MVKTWECKSDGWTAPVKIGKYVTLEDYQSLQAALREALRNWKDLAQEAEELEHIENLEKQFLDI